MNKIVSCYFAFGEFISGSRTDFKFNIYRMNAEKARFPPCAISTANFVRTHATNMLKCSIFSELFSIHCVQLNSERQFMRNSMAKSLSEMRRFTCAVSIVLILLSQFGQLCIGQRARRVKRIVGGSLAARPPPDDPVVFARAFSRDARVEGYRSV